MSINIGSRSFGLVQCWGKSSFCFIDRLAAVATTVIVTAAVTVLVTAAVIVTVTVGIPVPVAVTVSATAVAARVPATVAVMVFVTAPVRVSVTVENKKQLGPQPPPPTIPAQGAITRLQERRIQGGPPA